MPKHEPLTELLSSSRRAECLTCGDDWRQFKSKKVHGMARYHAKKFGHVVELSHIRVIQYKEVS